MLNSYDALAELEDLDLLELAHDGRDDALRILLDRYRGYARSKANRFFLPGADREDVVQEGMIGLFKAIRDYDRTKGPFSCFAELCVTRQIHTAIKSANRIKHRSLNDALSVEATFGGASGNPISLGERLVDPDVDPAERVVSADAIERLRESMTATLTELE